MNKNTVVIGSSLSAVSSSLVAIAAVSCCVGPALIAVLGTSGALAAARLAPYRSYFILGSIFLSALGFWVAYRPRGGCIGKACVTRAARITRVVMWLAVLITVVAILLPDFISG
jgi:hypothetical protein